MNHFKITNMANKRKELINSWAYLLAKFPWEWWVTLTFEYDTSLSNAYIKFKRWLRLLNRRKNHKVGFFIVTEKQDRDVLHLHLLMLGIGNLKPRTWEKKWIYGHARIKIYDEKKGARHYLAKRIEHCIDYQFGGSLKTLKMPEEVLKK